MFFSVVIPVYKAEKYLHQCIDSVLMQDFDDYELILVDDGSPDRCPEICDEYAAKDSRVAVIHKTNGGAGDARNAGILKAQGEYLCFLDSDDYWLGTDMLSQIAEKARCGNPDIINWGMMYLYHDSILIPKESHRNYSHYEGLSSADTLHQLVVEGKLRISSCLMSIRRSFLLSHDLLFKPGIKCEDIEWGVRIFIHEPTFAFLTENSFVYRQREGSVTATMDYAHLETYCQIIEELIERLQGCRPEIRDTLMSYIMYHLLICNALITRTDLTSKQRRQLHSRLKPLCREYLLKYPLNSKAKMGGKVYRWLGYAGMTKILGFYLTHRRQAKYTAGESFD